MFFVVVVFTSKTKIYFLANIKALSHQKNEINNPQAEGNANSCLYSRRRMLK